MITYNFRLYFEGYDSPKHQYDFEEHEFEGMTEEEKEEYIVNQITGYVKEQLEIIEVEEVEE